VAKKAKTPRPPVKAPQRRATSPDLSTRLSSMPRWAPVAAALAAAAVVAAVALSLTGGDDGTEGVRAAMTAAGCTLREVKPTPPKDKKNFHADVPTLETKVKWSTDPPSAGSHYQEWAIWNFYREEVNPRLVAHNLEHGGVAIWWGPQVPAETVDQLEDFYRESPAGMIGTPYPGLGDKIALTAWTGDPQTYYRNGDYGEGNIAICERFDRDAFAAFRDAYRAKGPEGVPLAANEPGTGP
jgi:hypothetical protein